MTLVLDRFEKDVGSNLKELVRSWLLLSQGKLMLELISGAHIWGSYSGLISWVGIRGCGRGHRTTGTSKSLRTGSVSSEANQSI